MRFLLARSTKTAHQFPEEHVGFGLLTNQLSSGINPWGYDMRFLFHDLGYLQSDTTVQVALSGSSANVRLMDAINYNRYRAGKTYRATSWYVSRSPFQVTTPHNGYWYVVIDRQGRSNRYVSSTAQILG